MMHWDWQGWNIKLYFSGWFCFEWSLSSSSPSCPIFDYASGCPAPFGSICAVPFRFRLPTSWSVRSAPSLPWIPCFSLSWSSARCGAPSAGPRSPAAAAPPGQPKSDCGRPTFRARLWSRWSLKCRSSPATSPCLSGSPPNGTRISCRLSWWPWRSFGGEIVWWPPRADGSRWSSLILDWWAPRRPACASRRLSAGLISRSGDFWHRAETQRYWRGRPPRRREARCGSRWSIGAPSGWGFATGLARAREEPPSRFAAEHGTLIQL